jgi:hypothetical protein
VKDLAVLVMSCDAYADLWEPFYRCFERYWPDCPCPIYHVGNHRPAPRANVESILVGDDAGWSAALRRALQSVQEPYLIIFPEDRLITEPVSTALIARMLDAAQRLGASSISLEASPLPDHGLTDPELATLIGAFQPGTLYSASTVAGLWNRDAMFDVARDDEDAWQFEIRGSTRTRTGFFATYEPAIKTFNAVVKGVLHPDALRHFRAVGCDPATFSRPIMPFGGRLLLPVHEMRSWLLLRIPSRWRARIRRWFIDT